MATTAQDLPDWGGEPAEYPIGKKVWLVFILAGPVIALLIFVSLLVGGNPIWLAASVFVLCAYTGFFSVGMTKRYLKKLAAVPIGPEHERFRNLVEGLAESHGLPKPALYVAPGDKANALILRGRPPVLCVTKTLVESYSRTEQEAVAAHCLVRLHSGNLFFTEMASRFGTATSRFAPKVGLEDDLQTVALTRYPPGLARALRNAGPHEGAGSCFWFAAHDPSHVPVAARINALQDL